MSAGTALLMTRQKISNARFKIAKRLTVINKKLDREKSFYRRSKLIQERFDLYQKYDELTNEQRRIESQMAKITNDAEYTQALKDRIYEPDVSKWSLFEKDVEIEYR